MAYFSNVGAALLAQLLIVDFWLPKPPLVEEAAAVPPIIRIHSERKWPERVVFDTTMVTVSGKRDTGIEISHSDVAPAAKATAPALREAFAMAPNPDSRRVDSINQNKRHVKGGVARSARRHARPHIMLASRQRPFDWFAFR